MNSINNHNIYFLILALFLYIGNISCSHNVYVKHDAQSFAAYGKQWDFYQLERKHISRPLFSGHGILVKNEVFYQSLILENNAGEKIIANYSMYATYFNGEIKQLPADIPYTDWTVNFINNRIYLRWYSLAEKIFNECKKFYPVGQPDKLLDKSEAYNYIGEYDQKAKRFVIDQYVPIPVNYSANSEYAKLYAGKKDIDFKSLLDISVKYVCE